ncbi:MAG: GntR family transcriptional regulator, partial [Emergencia timonensis]
MATILSVKEQTYQIIKEKILNQEYPAGARININELAEELGISNSPIREALSLLEQQGLVISNRSSGATVTTFT